MTSGGMEQRVAGVDEKKRRKKARWKAIWNNKSDNDAETNTAKTGTLKDKNNSQLKNGEHASRRMASREKIWAAV